MGVQWGSIQSLASGSPRNPPAIWPSVVPSQILILSPSNSFLPSFFPVIFQLQKAQKAFAWRWLIGIFIIKTMKKVIHNDDNLTYGLCFLVQWLSCIDSWAWALMNYFCKQHAPFGNFMLSKYYWIKFVGCKHSKFLSWLLIGIPAEF